MRDEHAARGKKKWRAAHTLDESKPLRHSKKEDSRLLEEERGKKKKSPGLSASLPKGKKRKRGESYQRQRNDGYLLAEGGSASDAVTTQRKRGLTMQSAFLPGEKSDPRYAGRERQQP